jgi:hypothetical protein
MSLPTSGYTATRVDYSLNYGSFSPTISVNVTQLGATLAEQIMAVLEPALLSLGEDLTAIDSTPTVIYKVIDGSTPNDELT